MIDLVDIDPAVAEVPECALPALVAGRPLPAPDLRPLVIEMIRANVRMARGNRAAAPWRGFLAVTDEAGPVGACAFKGPPSARAVEIAYVTFPPFERRGFATAMARELLAIAARSDEVEHVIAHTLPAESASSAILRRLGFAFAGSAVDPDDGPVWRFERRMRAGSPGVATPTRSPRME